MLEVRHLSAEVGGKKIIQDVSFEIARNTVMVLFGPNGSGKTSLLKTIMGFSGYDIAEGEIIFKGQVINSFPIEERVRLGLGIMYQYPPRIRGVKLRQIAEFLDKSNVSIEKFAHSLSLNAHLGREVNLDFSGGEVKRSELFQLMLQNPDLLLLDEPESGVDVENISLMGNILGNFLKKEGKSAFIITHTGYILDYIKAEKGCVMLDGSLWCFDDPKEIFESIKESGYEKCKECQ